MNQRRGKTPDGMYMMYLGSFNIIYDNFFYLFSTRNKYIHDKIIGTMLSVNAGRINMGLKYIREYDEIISELMDAIRGIDNFYSFLEMEAKEWNRLKQGEQIECVRTLSDDIFYALGSDPVVSIGEGIVRYVKEKSVIEVFNRGTCTGIIKLV